MTNVVQGFLNEGDSRLRLLTIVRLRWLAVLGQLIAVTIVFFGLGFQLPIGYCLGIIAMSAWLNVYLSIRYPSRHRLSATFASVMLAYDILQLAALLFLTGGVENPFTVLVLAPVTVSAATLPPRNTIVLGLVAAVATSVIVFYYYPLPWYPGLRLDMPFLYKAGILAAIVACMTFLALYAWRLSMESRQMSAALTATELVLAREQKLHALDGLAAAAAHELGTPLSTIVLVSKELAREFGSDKRCAEDLELLSSQARRCREILQKLTRRSGDEEDPLHASLSVREMMEEAAAPYRGGRKAVEIVARAGDGVVMPAAQEPVAHRRPGVIYGIGNIIENAVDFATSKVVVGSIWNAAEVVVTVTDDGPGFPAEVMDSLGEPYVTTRPGRGRHNGEASGLGLGFFIAKTLLERSGAVVSLENQWAPATGAVVRISWPRSVFQSPLDRSQPPAPGKAAEAPA
jgi:two-component system sensor histidine kinase RegB